MRMDFPKYDFVDFGDSMEEHEQEVQGNAGGSIASGAHVLVPGSNPGDWCGSKQ